MKILYVNPGRISSGLDAIIKAQPLSLISIAAMVPDHEAKLVDFKIEHYSDRKFTRILNKHDVVAISSLTPQVHSALEVAQMAKRAGCITILGGYHPSLAPEYVAAHPAVDYCVRGEGEHTFKEIIDSINRDNTTLEDKKKIKGLSYVGKNGNVIHNENRPLECHLDNFPLPRRDLIDYKKYLYLGKRVATLESSRGCPHNCTFCCITKMWKDPTQHIVYRSKSTERIMKEIYDVNWKNDFIFFCEDNFTIQIKRTKKILDAIIKSGVQNKIFFSCQSRVDSLYRNPWLVDLMHQAGVKQVFLGIESVHQQSLDAMNKKNTTPEMTRKVVNMLHDRGITIFGGIIIGFPGENKTMVRQTINFAKELELTCVQFTPITAFPGTQFFEEMKKEGKITSFNPKHYNLFNSMMRTDELTSKDLYRLVVEAYAAYYLYDLEWLKMVIKRFLNPFSNFSWMSHNITRLAKNVVRGGLEMLRSQGISSSKVSEELKQIMNNGYIEPASEVIKKIKNKNSIITSQGIKPIPVLENK